MIHRYKHAKQKDIENARQRGSAAMQNKTIATSLTQKPVNTEDFLKQKEEDVAVEDRFFYQFFKERARREVGHKRSKKVADEDDEEAMDRFAEDLAEEMMNQKVGSEDDDFLDDFEDYQNGQFLEDGEEVEMSDDDFGGEEEDEEEDDGHMIVDEFGKKPKKKDKSKSIYASAEEFEAMLAANAEEAAQKKKENGRKSQKRGYKGKKQFNKRRNTK